MRSHRLRQLALPVGLVVCSVAAVVFFFGPETADAPLEFGADGVVTSLATDSPVDSSDRLPADTSVPVGAVGELALASESVTDADGGGVCAYTNPNEPDDDPNALYGGVEGRDIVSANPIPSGYPTPLTTGICGVGLRPSDLTPVADGLTITEDGTVIDGMDITGTVNVEANDVTIRNSRLTADGHYVIELHSGYSGLVIEDTRVRGIETVTTIAVRGYATLRRVHVTGGKIGIRGSEGFLIEDSYFTGLYRTPTSHTDIVWVNIGSDYTVRGSTLIGPWARGTAVLFFHAKDDGSGGPIDDVLVEDNYISGGGYSIYTVEPDFSLTNTIVRNNRLELDSWNFGPFNDGAGATYEENRLEPSP